MFNEIRFRRELQKLRVAHSRAKAKANAEIGALTTAIEEKRAEFVRKRDLGILTDDESDSLAEANGAYERDIEAVEARTNDEYEANVLASQTRFYREYAQDYSTYFPDSMEEPELFIKSRTSTILNIKGLTKARDAYHKDRKERWDYWHKYLALFSGLLGLLTGATSLIITLFFKV